LDGLSDGQHTFEVRATDAVGNVDPTPDSRTWVVDTIAPAMTIQGPSSQYAKNTSTVTYIVSYDDLNLGPITLSPADITLVSPSGASATVEVFPAGAGQREVRLTNFTGNGELSISIAANTAVDLADNGAPAAGPSATFIVDNIKPVFSIGPPNVTSSLAGPVSWIVKVTDANLPPAYQLIPGHVFVLKSSPSMNANMAIDPLTSTATEKTFRVTLSNFTGGQGFVQIRINANVVIDLAQNASDQSPLSAVVQITGRKALVSYHGIPPTRMLPGSSFSFTVVGANTGTQTALGVALVVKLPAYGTFVPGASTPGWTAIGNGLYRLQLGDLAAKSKVVAKFTVQFAPVIPRGVWSSFASAITDSTLGGKLGSGRVSYFTFGVTGRLTG
jgi:hypothetical protein